MSNCTTLLGTNDDFNTIAGPSHALGWSTLAESAMDEIVKQRALLFASAVIGFISCIVAMATYIGLSCYSWACAHLYTVVEIKQRDQLYQWLLDWLAAQRAVHETGSRVVAEVHPEFHKSSKVSSHVQVRFLPMDDGSLYRFRLGGSLVWVSHHAEVGVQSLMNRKGSPSFTQPELRLRITALGRKKNAVHALLQDAFEHNKAKLGGCTEIFVAQPHENAESSHFRRLEPRRIRPLHTVVASSKPGPEELLDDMRAFFAGEEWYAERGVPYRRGYLFHGPPGCGKTTFVTAAAGQLKCPIYILNLAEPALSDLGLLKLVTDAPPRSILLMEDVDAAFHGVLGKSGSAGPQSQRDGLHMGQLTFSGLLNALDGVAGQEGKIVVMTTNHPEKLDGALVRPGRVDFRAEFHHASRLAIERIFCNFFADIELGKKELHTLAKQFAEQCPPCALPMAVVQSHLMQFRDDPKAAANSTLSVPSDNHAMSSAKQFVIPRGAAKCGGGEEE